MIIRCHYDIGYRLPPKAIHVTMNNEFYRHYVSENNSKMISGYVVSSVNKPTVTGRTISYDRVRYHLGRGTMRLADLNIISIKVESTKTASVSVTATYTAI